MASGLGEPIGRARFFLGLTSCALGLAACHSNRAEVLLPVPRLPMLAWGRAKLGVPGEPAAPHVRLAAGRAARLDALRVLGLLAAAGAEPFDAGGKVPWDAGYFSTRALVASPQVEGGWAWVEARCPAPSPSAFCRYLRRLLVLKKAWLEKGPLDPILGPMTERMIARAQLVADSGLVDRALARLAALSRPVRESDVDALLSVALSVGLPLDPVDS